MLCEILLKEALVDMKKNKSKTDRQTESESLVQSLFMLCTLHFHAFGIIYQHMMGYELQTGVVANFTNLKIKWQSE